ncbi:succinoglycan biosynthesis transport protein ExoP [Thioclava dalianensis]|nr:succinoglycan biosynthesis transport protein ExoP [Thioclava dalianensis]
MTKLRFQIGDSPNSMTPPTRHEPDPIDLSRLISALRRRRRVIFVCVAVWIVLGIVYLATTPRYYYAGSSILLDSNISRTIQQVSQSEDLSTNESALESARLVITSDDVANRVAAQLNLQDNPSFTNPPQSLLSKVMGTVMGAIKKPIGWLRGAPPEATTGSAPRTPLTPAQITERQQEAVARYLQQNVRVGRIGRSSAFSISFKSNDPVLAANVVNAFADVYISDVLNANYSATERMTEWMQGRLSNLQQDAQKAAEAAETFRVQNGLVTTRDTTISQDSVVNLNSDLSNAVSDAARAKAQVVALQAAVDAGPDALMKGVPGGLSPDGSAKFDGLQRSLSNAIANFDRIKAQLGPDDPQLAPYKARLQESATQLYGEIKQLLAQAKGEERLSEARVQALRDSVQGAVDTDASSGSAQVQLRALEQRAQTLSTLYQTFLAKFQQIDQQKSFPVSNVRMLSRAEPPKAAAGPRARFVLAFTILVGLMMGLVLAAIGEWRDRWLRTGDQLAESVGVPFLGYLPIYRTTDRPGLVKGMPQTPARGQVPLSRPGEASRQLARISGRSAIYALSHPRSLYTETLRNIRLAMRLSDSSTDTRILGITSARPAEGKTSTSLNLAAVIASTGASVLLIDADAHRQGLSRVLGQTTGAGLLEVLTGVASWRSSTKEIGDTGVEFLSCPTPEGFVQASEMLGGEGFRRFLHELRGEYDYVLLDLPPLGPVVDVRIVIGELDQLLFVAEWGKTTRALLRSLISSHPKIPEKLLGVVLSKVDLTQLRDYVDSEDSVNYLEEYGDYLQTGHS